MTVLDDSRKFFLVHSQTEEGRRCRVSFTEPKCECYDWARNYMPCKHLFAVLCVGLAVWDDLPPAYTNSPWLSLDPEAVSVLTPTSQSTSDAVQGTVSMAVRPDCTTCRPCASPRLQPKAKSLSSSCRELGRQVCSLTYLTTNEDALAYTLQQLQNCVD